MNNLNILAIPMTRWLPWLVFFVMTIITLFVAKSFEYYMQRDIQSDTQVVATAIETSLLIDINSRINDLNRMAKRISNRSQGMPQREWQDDAMGYMLDQSGYQAIEWLDANFNLQGVVIKDKDKFSPQDFIIKEEYKKRLLEKIKNSLFLMRKVNVRIDAHSLLIYVMIGEPSHFGGFIVGIMDFDTLVDNILIKTNFNSYDMIIKDEPRILYHHIRHHGAQGRSVNKSIVFDNMNWLVTIWPKPTVLSGYHTLIPLISLLTGLIAAALLALVTYFSQRAQQKAEESQQEMDKHKMAEKKLMLYTTKLETLAMLDSLTGLGNRRFLEQSMQHELEKLKMRGYPFSVLLIDIDFFKKINDSFGHVVGDKVLQKIGGILRGNVRETDSVSRYGGEEFCVILANTTNISAKNIAEKLRICVANDKFIFSKDLTFNITCSIGVCQVSSPNITVNEIFAKVDKALYQAKNSGRNCIYLDADVQPVPDSVV